MPDTNAPGVETRRRNATVNDVIDDVTRAWGDRWKPEYDGPCRSTIHFASQRGLVEIVTDEQEGDTTEPRLLDEYVAIMRQIHSTLLDAYGHAEAQHEPPALHALALATEALDWVDDPPTDVG